MIWGALIGAAGSALGGALGGSKKQKTAKQPKWLTDASKYAVTQAQNLSQRPYTAFEGERVAGLTPNEQAASRLAGNFGERMKPLEDRLTAGFSRGALDQYMNPFIDQVLGNQRRVIGEEYGRQAASLQARQSAMDAFRSGRSDLARSRLDKDRLTALGDAEALGQAGAFDRALGAYFQQGEQDRGAYGALAQVGGQEIDQLGRTGAIERSVEQAGRDFDYGQFLEKRDWSVNNLTPLLNAIQAARGDTKVTESESKSPWGAVGGLLGDVIGSVFGNKTSNGSSSGGGGLGGALAGMKA